MMNTTQKEERTKETKEIKKYRKEVKNKKSFLNSNPQYLYIEKYYST